MLRPFNLGAVDGCVPKIREPAHHTDYYSPEQEPVTERIAFKKAHKIEAVEGFGQVAKTGWLNVGHTNREATESGTDVNVFGEKYNID